MHLNGDVTQGRAQIVGARLTATARTAWAKHDRKTDGWLPLWRHMADSAAVAGMLWDRWVPRNVRRLVADVLPAGEDDARRLAVWLAAAHDIGKATPAFACQVDGLADRMRAAGLEMPPQKQLGDDRRLAPHGLAGQLLLQEWLSGHYGWSDRGAAQFAVVAGGHHGVPPGHGQIHDLDLHPELLRTPGPGEEVWRRVQAELLEACAQEYEVTGRLPDWRTVKLPQPVQVLLTALVIVADWIASNPDLFPYYPEERSRTENERISAAWRGLSLPEAWSAEEPEGSAAELFAARFDLPLGARIRPVQEEAVRRAREMGMPGLMVIEAPMGEGKTEAALAVAEIFAARSGAGGCFVALPTRATGDAMFPRLLQWLEHLPGGGGRTVFLAHAKAALNDRFAGLMRAGARTIAAVEMDGPEDVSRSSQDVRAGSAELVAHQWLRGRKKGMLSSFAVGTIDQLLFAGLKSRHLALRHLALAGKVVVIDEVHAYDAYMNVYLERVLSWLGSYRVPVVMLSATLPAARRRALVEAYAGASVDVVAVAEADGYPLLTAVPPEGAPVIATPPAASDRRTDIWLEPLGDDVGLLADRLGQELSEGGCALVVRNTVDRVLETAERLRERFGPANVTVAHSRFLDVDRARKDADLLARFGRDGNRPRSPHVVVASQVAEQSLDIDFDLLVTDLAPVDLVLQRMGRLHRHQRDRPARLRTARCLLTGVDWRAEPPEPVRGSRAVYGLHTLLRSLAVLQPLLDGRPLSLPQDISRLVQRAYGDAPEGPETWARAMAEAYEEHQERAGEQRARAEVFRLDEVRKPGRALIGWIDAGVGDADDTRAGRAQVRDSEESLEVLVVQRRADGTLTTVPWLERGLGGLELPTDAVPHPRAARAVAASALRLPYHFSKPWVLDRAIGELEELCVPSWQAKDCHWLAGELILVLDEDCRTRLAGYELHYSSVDGLQVTPAGARDVRLVNGVPSFDLVSRPWLPVQRADGTTAELSLREVFAEAKRLRRLVGDVPTQEFALLRLLLAIVHDAVDGPEDLDEWEEMWGSEDPFAQVATYLDRHRERFDLLHPTAPFYQVAGLRTEKDEVASLNRIVADVPNGDPFFTMRMPQVERLSFAEAARWVVHAHAYDTSGIKSGAVGDPRVKGGKGYPQGVAWVGNLGGVLAEGRNLRETLLLNLIAADTGGLRVEKDDRPAWRREPCGPAAAAKAELASRPSGTRDLYTWQSRRLRLHHDGDAVHGVVLCYGDPLSPQNMHPSEPMTGWRRSKPQEKKLGRPLVYMPREHDPTRGAWRGLGSLLQAGHGQQVAARGGEAPDVIRPRVLDWVARLATEGAIPRRSLIRARIVGAVYGTQQSVIDEMIDDGVTMSVILLHERDPRYGQAAVDAVSDAEGAVTALGDLAADLAKAAGSEPEPFRNSARDLGFAALDGPYRLWLRELGDSDDPGRARGEWQRTTHRTISARARELLNAAGKAAWEGRIVDTPKGPRWLDDTSADWWFRGRLNRALHHPFATAETPNTH
ncbi:type I-E CRISPR-associated protein Cse1/CasA [Streptomyces sparsogenes]|nr:type I-E CRISPR-associated protein Cse1/CasA [Streptomyces sparsogenes]